MKTFSRLSQPVLLSLVLVLAFALSAHSQATLEECNAIYQVLTANRNSNELTKLEQAVASGKEYLGKCKAPQGSDPPEEIIKYINTQIPRLEERITTIKLETAYNATRKQKKYDEMVSAAKQLIERDRPYALDLMLDIASIGFDNATANPPVDKYNADAITFAKLALAKMGAGATSGNQDRFGYYVSYKNDKCADGKANAIGWMNYTIGFITLAREKKAKDGLPFLYRASQEGCETKVMHETYRLIGSWYIDEAVQIGARRGALLTAENGQETAETSSLFDLQKGYVDRAIDAYARAYRFATANQKTPASYKDAVSNKLKELFAARHDGDTSKMEAYLAKVLETPFPDPATPVTPVATVKPTP